MNLRLLDQEVAHIKRPTQKSILGLNGLLVLKCTQIDYQEPKESNDVSLISSRFIVFGL